MRGKLELSQIGPRLLLLSACASVTGCPRTEPHPLSPPASPPPEAAKPYSNSFGARGWTYHLRHLEPAAAADAGKAKELWSNLFPEMAKDPKTRDLLKHLHAGLPVELVVLDAEQAGNDAVLNAPPPEGSVVAMRVADISHEEEKSGASTVPVRVIAYSRVILIKDAVASAVHDSLGALAEDWKNAPSPGEPLSLAMEDYTLRHAPGWAVIGGPIDKDEKVPSSVGEQRKDLDRRIKDYADHAKSYYGALRQRR
jgi:hypothetical protein